MSDSSTLGVLASVAMAVGAPLVYADQAWSINKRRNSEGFSKDVCAVLLIANLARVFWWFQERYELALLLQSVLMIASQIGLLSLVLVYQPGSYASAAYTASSEDYRYGNQSARPQRPQITVEPPTPTRETPAAQLPQQAATPSIHSSSPNSREDLGSAAFRALFGPGSSSSGGKYSPLMGDIRFPTMPVLDTSGGLEEGEEETEEGSMRGRMAALFSKARGQLKVLLGVRSDGSLRKDGSDSSRPFGFWTWRTLPSYLLFLATYSLLLLLLLLLFGRSSTYSFVLGLFALGLESSLPVPQFMANQRRRSLSGFRLSVLGGWLLGDAFKTVYFVANGSPVQFLLGGIFALGVDLAIVAQARAFQEQTAKDDEEERLSSEARAAEDARSAGSGGGGGPGGVSARTAPSSSQSPWTSEQADLEDDRTLFDASRHQDQPKSKSSAGTSSRESPSHGMFAIEADDD